MDEDEWRFSLEDLDEETEESSGGNVAGDWLPDEQLEPGDVGLENAFFVAVGVAVAGLVFVAFVFALT